jgi:hypothetical protein
MPPSEPLGAEDVVLFIPYAMADFMPPNYVSVSRAGDLWLIADTPGAKLHIHIISVCVSM